MNTFTEATDNLINTYSTFSNIMNSLDPDINFKQSLEQIYQLFLSNVNKDLWLYYKEFMNGIDQFTINVKSRYGESTILMIPDFLEFIYSTLFYDTFLLNYHKVHNKVKSDELMEFFYLIIVVEHYKYYMYQDILNKLPAESEFLGTIRKRIKWCLMKIGFSYKLVCSTKCQVVVKCKEYIEKENIFYYWNEIDQVKDFFEIMDEH